MSDCEPVLAVGPAWGGVGATFDGNVAVLRARGRAVHAHRIEWGGTGAWRALHTVLRLRRELRSAAVVYVEFGRPDHSLFWFALIAIAAGKRVVLMVHDPPEVEASPAAGLLPNDRRLTSALNRRVLGPLLDARLLAYVLDRAGAVVVLGVAARDELAPRCGGTVLASPHGLFETSPAGVAPSASGYVLMAGFIGPSKGLETLLDAWSRIDAGRMRLVIAGAMATGDVTFANAISAAAKRCASPPVWLGPIADEPSFDAVIANAAAVVLPYRRASPASGILVRAMSFGRPVIATCLGAAATTISDGQDGLLVAVDDPEQLARALSGVAADGALRDRLGVAAAARARELFSWERAGDVLVAALRAAAE